MIVGFIGLCIMGCHAALDMCRAGCDIVIYELHPPAADPLRGLHPADVLDSCDEW
jgi:3-hydroxyisobutyrate dehydrogenase-like beta-hydroxyacid dehydrogenase